MPNITVRRQNMASLTFKSKKEVEAFFETTSQISTATSATVKKEYDIILSSIENNGDNIVTVDFVLTGRNKHHTVRLQYDGKETGEWFLWCNADADKDTACNFHQGNSLRPVACNGNIYEVCKHIIGVCDAYKDSISYITDDMLSEAGVIEKPAKKDKEPFEQLKRFAFKIPVLIEGDRGSGKTYEAFEYAKSLDIEPSFVGGHAGIESIDLLGCLVPYAGQENKIEDTSVSAADFFSGDYQMNISSNNSNSLIWKDGPIAEAFRKAQNGKKSILIIDELLRIPQRELNILLTALSPVHGKYNLRTGRILEVIDGIAREEVLSCDTRNLFVLATTNVGGQYAVDTIDPALAERFIVVRKDTEVDTLIYILKNKAEEKGFNYTIAQKAGLFFKKMTNAREQGLVAEIPTLRTLSRAFDLAEQEDEVKDYILAQKLLWVDRDVYGKPVKEQIELVERIVNDYF